MAVLFDQEGDDLAGLVVGEHEVVGGLGVEEGLGEAADRGGFALEDHLAVVGGEGHAPGGVALGFFEDGDAFAEPAGHAVFGGGEGDDVTELVPEGGLPVVAAMAEAAGAVHGDDGAEAGAEDALAAEVAEGADGEVLLAREELDEDGAGEGDLVALGEGLVGLFEEVEGVLAVDGPFAAGHFEGEVRGAFFVVGGDLFFEGAEVDGLDVVGVLGADGGGKFEGFGFFAEAEEVMAELDFGGEVAGREGEGLALAGGAFGEAVGAGDDAAEGVVDEGILGPAAEAFGAGGVDFGCVCGGDGEGGGAEGPGGGVGGVEVEDGLDIGLGVEVFFGADVEFGAEEEGTGVMGVDFEGAGDVFGGGGAI